MKPGRSSRPWRVRRVAAPLRTPCYPPPSAPLRERLLPGGVHALGHRVARVRRPRASAPARGGPRRSGGAERLAPAAPATKGAHSVPGDARRAPPAWMPTGVASTGTSQASASSTARPKPSRSEGTTTASAALTHSGTSSGATSPSVEQLDPGRAREREREVVALLRPCRVGREQQVAAILLEAQRLTRLRARRSGAKRSMSTPQGSTIARERARRPGSSRTSAAETAADEVHQRRAPARWPGGCAGASRRCRARSARAPGPARPAPARR